MISHANNDIFIEDETGIRAYFGGYADFRAEAESICKVEQYGEIQFYDGLEDYMDDNLEDFVNRNLDKFELSEE